MTSVDIWTARLAAVLAGNLPAEERAQALSQLATSPATGQRQIDDTRARILQLLAQRDRQTNPTTHLNALPPLHAQGIAGISLVALCQGHLPMAAVKNWLTTAVDNLVLVDCHTTPPLADCLREARLTDPRLVVIRLDLGDVTWPQAFNIGLRAARHSRLWAVANPVRLTGTPLAALPPGTFATALAGGGFVIDLHRSDLAAAGGFNEHFASADGAVADLASRLSALGLTAHPVDPALIAAGPRPTAAEPPGLTGTLRDSLLHDASFATLRNQHLAARMPVWTAAAQRPCMVLAQDDLGQHILPQPSPLPPMADATHNALTDLLRARIGGHPERLTPAQLDLILSRPATDVTVTDLVMAAGPAPDLVTSRKAWLVITAAASPPPGSPLHTGLMTLRQMAATHGQTALLQVDQAGDPLPGIPVLTSPFDPATFWPTELRELARPLGGRAPRHATMPLNDTTLTDLHRLTQSPAVLLRRPKIFIDAQHGLGNRLRAIASAGAIAQGTDRELVVIWAPDDHCACLYDDLFVPHGAVLSQGFAPDAPAMGMDLYNYMEVEPGSAKDAPIQMGAFQDVYIRSAYPLVSPCSNWHSENAYLKTLRPNDVVRDLIASVRHPNDLSLHLRSEGGTGAEHLPYEAAANWTAQAHQDIDHWRKRSQLHHFLPRLDQLIAQGLAERIFVAADTPAAYAALQARYGNRISWLPRPASDRSALSITYALADAILLGRAPRLLGSNWSSFSELAARLSPAPMTVELAGRDF